MLLQKISVTPSSFSLSQKFLMSIFKCWQINVFNTVLKTKTCLQATSLVDHKLATLVWSVEFHTERSGVHPVVTDLRDVTFISKFA